VAISWTAGSNNGAAITDYIIEYKLASSSSWTTFADGTSTSTSSIVTGLTNGASYNFRVSAVNANGTSNSSSTASATPISGTPSAPTAVSVAISGSASVGEQITGTYVFADPNGDSEATSIYRWLRSDTVNGSYSAIPGATGINYTVTLDDVGKYIKFEVTPISSTSPTSGNAVLSSATSQVNEVNYFNHILSTGQSLSTGTNGAPALSTTQPYSNKMLSGASLVPLVESGVETMSSALANTLTSLSPTGDFQSAVTRHGIGGTAYSGLKKGTSAYSTGLSQASAVKAAAEALGYVDRVIGVTTIHGESDHLAGNSASYESYLVEWQNDYNTDVKAITGQTTNIPLFTDQMSSQTGYNSATSGIPMAQLAASVDHPGDIILVGPKYFFNYSDTAHLTNTSYRWLGEYYGKVIKKVAIDHQAWRPLSPDTVTRNNNEIYARFHVPAGVLAFDTNLVTARTNYGFEYYDSTSSASITSVEIIDADTVKITLSGTPTGTNQRLRYAYTGIPGTQPGAQNSGSAGGNLRDTDNTASLYGNTLYNWAVHFDEPISVDSIAPVISNLDVTTTNNSATITWTTNENSSTYVEYGITGNYEAATSETDTGSRVTSHTVTINSLVPCSTYFFRARGNDAAFNNATSGNLNVFSTKGCTSNVLNGSTSNVDNSTGGTASLHNITNSITLQVPAGSVGGDATFIINQLDTSTAIDSVGSPSGFKAIDGYTYEFKSLTDVNTEVSSFNHSLTITIHYDPSDLPANISESSLVIYHYHNGNWSALTNCTVDTTAHSISCDTDNFSVFSLMGVQPQSSGGGIAPAVPGSNTPSTSPAGNTSGTIPKPAQSPVGSNIVTPDGTIYTIMADGTRRPYTSAGAFLSYGFNTFPGVIAAKDGDLTLTAGSFIPPRDGSVICSDRSPDKGTCYLITAGKKAGFTSATVFKGQGFSFSNSSSGDVSFLETLPPINTSQQAHRYGTLINNEGTIQIIGDNTLIGIPSMDVLISWGYNLISTVLANSYDKTYIQSEVLQTRSPGIMSW
jgi:hypothetical protein